MWRAERDRGLACLAQGQLSGARGHLELALDLAPSSVEEAVSLADLASLRQAEGQFDEAEALLGRAISQTLSKGAEQAETLASFLTSLAGVLHAQSRRSEAEAVLNRAWVVTLAGQFPPLHFYEVAAATHPSRVFRAALRAIRVHLRPERALVRCAGPRAIFGGLPAAPVRVDWDGALPGGLEVEPGGAREQAFLAELAGAVQERLVTLGLSLEPCSESLWAQERARGLAALEAGARDTALEALEGALDRAELWGLEDVRVASSLNSLAQAYLACGRPQDAQAAIGRALSVLEGRPDHPLELAASLTQLARLLGPAGEELLDRAWVLTLQAGDPHAPYRTCLRELVAELRAERGLVLRLGAEGLRVVARHGFPPGPLNRLKVDHALLRHLAETGAPLLLSDARASGKAEGRARLSGLRSLACGPLWDPAGQVHGLLYADLTQGSRGFSRRDMQRLQLLARQLEQRLFA